MGAGVAVAWGPTEDPAAGACLLAGLAAVAALAGVDLVVVFLPGAAGLVAGLGAALEARLVGFLGSRGVYGLSLNGTGALAVAVVDPATDGGAGESVPEVDRVGDLVTWAYVCSPTRREDGVGEGTAGAGEGEAVLGSAGGLMGQR